MDADPYMHQKPENKSGMYGYLSVDHHMQKTRNVLNIAHTEQVISVSLLFLR